jgi:tetratricopeptide (TPR) repeat protein
LDPNSAINRLSLAVIYGRLAGYGNVKTKVDYAPRIKDEAEAALALDQEYAWAYHVLGRWHVEMSEIGQAKRFLASLLFGGLSQPSLDTAIELLEKAVELEPESIAHRVELGYAYEADGREERAREQWQTALDFDSRYLYDPAAKDRAREALGLTPQYLLGSVNNY